jgi:hypothetical protein
MSARRFFCLSSSPGSKRGQTFIGKSEVGLRERVEELEAELARLRGLPAPGHDTVGHETAITPPTGDIVPRSEYEGVPPMTGPDDGRGQGPVIEGKVVKREERTVPEPRILTDDEPEPWRPYVQPL